MNREFMSLTTVTPTSMDLVPLASATVSRQCLVASARFLNPSLNNILTEQHSESF
jgi:hypothetical protein